MTGYTVHTGSSEKFAAGWDDIFVQHKAKKAKKKPPATSTKKTASQASEKGKKKKKG